jgi:hypothetical protein
MVSIAIVTVFSGVFHITFQAAPIHRRQHEYKRIMPRKARS